MISDVCSPYPQLQSAFDHFNEYRNILKMTTGSAELDSLPEMNIVVYGL
jgi:hypothetical protein